MLMREDELPRQLLGRTRHEEHLACPLRWKSEVHYQTHHQLWSEEWHHHSVEAGDPCRLLCVRKELHQ